MKFPCTLLLKYLAPASRVVFYHTKCVSGSSLTLFMTQGLKEALHFDSGTAPAAPWDGQEHCSGHLAASTQAAELSWQARQRVQSGTWLHRAQSGASQSAHAQIQSIHGHAWYNHLLGGGYDQKDASGNRDNCNGCWVSFSWTLLEAMEKLSISNFSGSAQVEGAITPLHHGAVCLKE